MSEEIIVPDEVIAPLNREEYQRLKDVIRNVHQHLPENQAPFIWDMFNRLRGMREPRPCTCASAGAHWARAVDYLRNWLKDK
jgi:hypothetical protein